MLKDHHIQSNDNKLNYQIIEYKNQISLLSSYLLLTFDAINAALEQCIKLIEDIHKIKEKKSLNKTENSNSSSLNTDYLSTEEKNEDLLEPLKIFYGKGKIGKYHWKIRAMKILKYKIKQIIRQGKVPISTKYSGRSKVALQKPRCHGRFVKINK